MTVNANETMSEILWRRLRYMLSPQFDLYKNIAPRMKDKSVLEVGFGTGFGTLQLAYHAKAVSAIEPDHNAVSFANRVLPLHNVAFVTADITELRLPVPLYDAVVMVETLEHIAEWEKALANIHAALLPGGCLYMTARNRNADLRRNDLHEREWSAQELAYNLGAVFDDVKLFDYTLTNEMPVDTHVTPLIAVARKASDEDIRTDLGAWWFEGSAGQEPA